MADDGDAPPPALFENQLRGVDFAAGGFRDVQQRIERGHADGGFEQAVRVGQANQFRGGFIEQGARFLDQGGGLAQGVARQRGSKPAVPRDDGGVEHALPHVPHRGVEVERGNQSVQDFHGRGFPRPPPDGFYVERKKFRAVLRGT